MHHAAELHSYFILVPFAHDFYFASNRNLKINTTIVFTYNKSFCFLFFFNIFFPFGDLTITTHLSVFPLGNKAIFYVHLFDLIFCNLFKI